MSDDVQGSTVPPMIRQGELVEQIAREILGAVSQPFTSLEYSATILTGYAESGLLITHPDGTVESEYPPRSVSPLARELRGVMYSEGTGTWFSMTLSISDKGSASAGFNFTDAPPLDQELSPSVYADELKKYPRDDAHVPEWLRAQAARA